MRRKIIKLQRRDNTTAINIPKTMLPGIGDDVRFLELRQYRTGKISIWPIHEGELK